MSEDDRRPDGDALTCPIDAEVRALLREDEAAEAVDLIQAHLVAHPDDAVAHELLATALKQAGDAAGAAGALLAASERHAAAGRTVQSVSARAKATELGVEPDFGAVRAVAGGATSRVPSLLLDDLNDEEFAELAAGLASREFEPGETVVEEGAAADSLFVVARGSVLVTTRQGDRDVELARLGPGDFFGESALLSGRPRTATIRAIEPTDCLELSRPTLDGVIARHPRVREVMDEFNRRRAGSTVETLLGRRGG
jgi:hypothetical protein